MDPTSFPNTRWGQSSPTVEPGFTGVRIAARPRISAAGAMIVSGIYQIVEEEARRIDERLHRAVVLVVTSSHCSFVTTPFQGTVLFEDDDERFDWGRRGYFNLDVFRTSTSEGAAAAADFGGLDAIEPGDYFLFASLGGNLSNVVLVTVG